MGAALVSDTGAGKGAVAGRVAGEAHYGHGGRVLGHVAAAARAEAVACFERTTAPATAPHGCLCGEVMGRYLPPDRPWLRRGCRARSYVYTTARTAERPFRQEGADDPDLPAVLSNLHVLLRRGE